MSPPSSDADIAGIASNVLWHSTTYRAKTKRFGILIDAGSSGSRAFVYHWPMRRFRSTPPDLTTPVLQHKGSYKTTPGLSSCIGLKSANTQDTDSNTLALCVRDLLTPLLKHVEQVLVETGGVSPSVLQKVPCYLTATAGMRVLLPAQREELMDVIRTELTDSVFHFEWEWARVISGEEEALYAWIAVNSFMGTFSKKEIIPDRKRMLMQRRWQQARTVDTRRILRENTGHPTRTHGAIDLGGASVQIAFEPSSSILSHAFLLRLPSRLSYDLYTKSYLFFGQDAARDRSTRFIVESALEASSGRRKRGEPEHDNEHVEGSAKYSNNNNNNNNNNMNSDNDNINNDSENDDDDNSSNSNNDYNDNNNNKNNNETDIYPSPKFDPNASDRRLDVDNSNTNGRRTDKTNTDSDKNSKTRQIDGNNIYRNSVPEPLLHSETQHSLHSEHKPSLHFEPQRPLHSELQRSLHSEHQRSSDSQPQSVSGGSSTAAFGVVAYDPCAPIGYSYTFKHTSSTRPSSREPRYLQTQRNVGLISVNNGRYGYDEEDEIALDEVGLKSRGGEHMVNGRKLMSQQRETTTVTVKGSSDWEECSALTYRLINKAASCFVDHEELDVGQCAFNGQYQPSMDANMTFIAFSAFPHINEFLRLKPGADLVEYKEKGKRICEMDLQKLREYNLSLGEPQLDRYLLGYCFSSQYVYHLMVNGLGFAERGAPVVVMGEVGGNELNYAFGAMLFDANFLKWTYIHDQIEWTIILATVITTLNCVALLWCCKRLLCGLLCNNATIKNKNKIKNQNGGDMSIISPRMLKKRVSSFVYDSKDGMSDSVPLSSNSNVTSNGSVVASRRINRNTTGVQHSFMDRYTPKKVAARWAAMSGVLPTSVSSTDISSSCYAAISTDDNGETGEDMPLISVVSPTSDPNVKHSVLTVNSSAVQHTTRTEIRRARSSPRLSECDGSVVGNEKNDAVLVGLRRIKTRDEVS